MVNNVTNNPLINVSIYDRKQVVGLTTDSLGIFDTRVLPGPCNLTFSAVGYYTQSRFLKIDRADILLEVALNSDTRHSFSVCFRPLPIKTALFL